MGRVDEGNTVLICSCNLITKQEIEETIRGFLIEDPWTLITPSRVYHEMNKRGRCCGCFPNVINIIVATTENFHRQADTPEAAIIPFVAEIREEHNRCETVRLMEMRQNAAKRKPHKTNKA